MFHRAPNKRLIARSQNGRFRKTVAADVGMATCGTCNAVFVPDYSRVGPIPDPAEMRDLARTCPECRAKGMKFVILQGLEEGNRFFTENVEGQDPTKGGNGETWYRVVGYADSVEEAQTILYGRRVARREEERRLSERAP